MLLHNTQNLDDDLGSGSDEHLTLASSFGVDNVVETVVEDGDSDHFGGVLLMSGGWGEKKRKM